MVVGPDGVKVGEGTLTTKELVTGLVTAAIPPGVIVVIGVPAGTVGEVIVKLGYVPLIVVGPEFVNVGEGTLTTKELVTGLLTDAIPPGVMVVLGVDDTEAVVTRVP